MAGAGQRLPSDSTSSPLHHRRGLMRFIRMSLNDGNGEHGRVLKSDTVRMAEKNHLGGKENRDAARGDCIVVQRRGGFPRTVEVVDVDLYGQRRRGTDRAPCRRTGL